MWIKASERRPTEADALDGWVLWRASKDDPPFMGRWDGGFVTSEWRSILEEPEPAQEPELPQPGQDIWVKRFDDGGWNKKTLLRWKLYPVTASRSGKNEIIWHEWSLTNPEEPPEPQYRPFKNAEEFWPYRNCWWRAKKKTEAYPPTHFDAEFYGGSLWADCLRALELLEDIDGKMVARPFGMRIEPETNIS
jgi:hypothetical protein